VPSVPWHLGTKVIICKPADPEAKGLAERLHDYDLERSFLPGRRFLPAGFQQPARCVLGPGQLPGSIGCWAVAFPTRLLPLRTPQPIVTTNKAFGRWGEVLGDEVVATMIDRLVHHADVIALKRAPRLKNQGLGRVHTEPADTE
jgi:hypothetical protein